MPSDPPLHVALGPDLRRPSVRLLKVIPIFLYLYTCSGYGHMDVCSEVSLA